MPAAQSAVVLALGCRLLAGCDLEKARSRRYVLSAGALKQHNTAVDCQMVMIHSICRQWPRLPFTVHILLSSCHCLEAAPRLSKAGSPTQVCC